MMDLTIPFGRLPSLYKDELAAVLDAGVDAERRDEGEMKRML